MARCSVSRKPGGVLSGHATVRDAGRAIRRHRFRSRFHAGGTAAPQTAGVHGDHIMTTFKDLFDLKGRTAVVTGGCGILGRRFAEGLAEFGVDVAIIDLDQAATDAAAVGLAARHLVRARGYGCDITDPTSVRNTADAIEADLG